MKEPPSPEEFRGRIRAALERRPWLACDAGGDIAGYACASQFNLRESFRG
jgi:L-amino acid N-acyltransferase YncA